MYSTSYLLNVFLLASFSKGTAALIHGAKTTSSQDDESSMSLRGPARFQEQRNAQQVLQTCPAQTILGNTHYFYVAPYCVKAEVFPTGVLTLDPANTDCTAANESGQTQTISNYANYDIYTGSMAYEGNWSGFLYFKEDPSQDTEQTVASTSIDIAAKTFIVSINYSTCPAANPILTLGVDIGSLSCLSTPAPTTSPTTTPSGTCLASTYITSERTYVVFVPSLSACLKYELKSGGQLFANTGDDGTDCSQATSFPTAYSSMSGINGNTVEYLTSVSGGVTGRVTITFDTSVSTVTSSSFTFISGVFEGTIELPSCDFNQVY